MSAELKSLFPAHLNRLGLERPDGTRLTLDANGDQVDSGTGTLVVGAGTVDLFVLANVLHEVPASDWLCVARSDP